MCSTWQWATAWLNNFPLSDPSMVSGRYISIYWWKILLPSCQTPVNRRRLILTDWCPAFKVGSHLKCKSNAIFFKTCRHILLTTWISSIQNKWGITMLVFELFWYNLDMEWQGNPPLSLTKTKWMIICDFISYFMCNVGQHISKTSMATPQLFYIDEIHVLQRILLQFFKQIALLLYFRCKPP